MKTMSRAVSEAGDRQLIQAVRPWRTILSSWRQNFIPP